MKKRELKKKQVLTLFEAELLNAVGCLCSEGAVSLHSFTVIFSPEKTHEIVHSIEGFALQGHLKYFDDVIYGPLNNYWKSKSLRDSLMQEMLERLIEKTTIPIYQDRLHVRDYFLMAYSFAKHMERTVYNINYTLFAGLVCNLAQYVDIWYPQNTNAERTEDICIVRILSSALDHIPSDSPFVSKLHSQISLFFTNAWRYELALNHLKKAEESDICLFGTIKGHCCLAYAEYYYNYSQLAVALKYYRMAVDMAETDDEYTKICASAKISLILTLLGETQFNDWIQTNTHIIQFLPEIHELKILYYLTLALQEDSLESATNYISRAKLILIQLNHLETPIGGVLHYVYSEILSIFAYKLRSLQEYKKYVLNALKNFNADEGGWDILFAGRIVNHLDEGSLTTAKILSIRELDSIVDIYSSDLSFSVKSGVCKCYVRLYKDLKLFPLALTYNQIYEVHRKLYKPSQKTLEYIAPLFNDGIPTSITLDTAYETAFEKLHIEIYMKEQRQSSGKTIDEIRKRIDELRLLYPDLNVWLLIAEGRLDANKDIRKAIGTWKKAIDSASHENIFGVSIEVARFCNYYGLVFEAAEFYKRAIDSETFQSMTTASQFHFYMEYVLIVENCGFRSVAMPYWEQLESIANEEQLPILMLNRAVTEWNFENYETCHLYLTEFLGMYKQTEEFDELLSSGMSYLSSLQIQSGEYEGALESIKKSISLWIAPKSYDSFPQYWNKTYAEIALNAFSDARKSLKIAEGLARTNADKEMVNELYEYLQKQRKIYFKE